MNELVEIAILAYRNGRYRDAIDMLLQVTDADSKNWMARLYLGMSYEKIGRVLDAHRLFKRLVAECPESHIVVKAQNAIPLVEAEMRRRFEKETLPQNKPTNRKRDDDDIVWVG